MIAPPEGLAGIQVLTYIVFYTLILGSSCGHYVAATGKKGALPAEFGRSARTNLGVLRGSFSGFGCPKRHPDALLAKTMIASSNYTGEVKTCVTWQLASGSLKVCQSCSWMIMTEND